jgi:hypothetical protein
VTAHRKECEEDGTFLPGAFAGAGCRQAAHSRRRKRDADGGGRRGTPYGGWVVFQPLYQRIVKEQIDPID